MQFDFFVMAAAQPQRPLAVRWGAAVHRQNRQVLITVAKLIQLKTGAQPSGMLSAPTSANLRAYLQIMERLA